MGAAAAGGIAAIGTVYVSTDRYGSWIRDVLRRSLPGYSFDPEGLARFVAEYDARQPFSIKRRVLAAAEGLIDTKPFLPQRKAEHLAESERLVLSDFLVGSDFFENYPGGSRVITYRGARTACGSPFARFEPEG